MLIYDGGPSRCWPNSGMIKRNIDDLILSKSKMHSAVSFQTLCGMLTSGVQSPTYRQLARALLPPKIPNAAIVVLSQIVANVGTG